ncbi:hypothetical protein SIA70_20175 [Bacillus subtilis]|uniref:Uncharacterized protein n=2 Tax=Bacillus subtilis TaxID=1423 RepID=S5E149_BACIU|nr:MULTISPECIES: hypothetical protein [Bacillus]AGQ21316.1 unknown [Bacillus subtilis subsp. subtilis NCIB 3610 = ATCC 6051 = DSM 10]BAJ77053.1 hypothetical protein [Bacillus subtilis subsp. natto]BBK74894.1 hypothetical protein NBRC13719_42390 [Bacillus subtilis subsp. subtilis]MDM5455706.1 hypothetical protein [Bacillus subtilis]MDX6158410.1 hypothetical protein [Bacillus subtilis]
MIKKILETLLIHSIGYLICLGWISLGFILGYFGDMILHHIFSF